MTAVLLEVRGWAAKTVFISLASWLEYNTKQLRQPLLLHIEDLVYFLIVKTTNSIYQLIAFGGSFDFLVIKQLSVNYSASECNAFWGAEIIRQNFLHSKCHKVLTSQYERFSACQTNSKSASYWSMCVRTCKCMTWNVKPESTAKLTLRWSHSLVLVAL